MKRTYRGLIATVGGTADPIVVTIEQQRPEFVLFVVSDESRGTAELVAEASEPETPPQYSYLEVSDPQDFGSSYEEIRRGTDLWLTEKNLAPLEVTADITGGTKVLSAALALSGAEQFQEFTYVGGEQRDKGGLGVVRNGTEYVITSLNPWDTYAVRDLERANHLLAGYNAELAADVLEEAAKKCNPDLKNRLNRLGRLARKFGEADRFSFRNPDLPKYLNGANFRVLKQEFPQLEPMGDHWLRVAGDLTNKDCTPGRSTLLELLANARRRAAQGRYDDGTGRLYRAVELYAQQLVEEAFGVELGCLTLSSIPAGRRDAFSQRMGNPPSGGVYRIGVAQLYQALNFSEDPGIRKKAIIQPRLAPLLENRNNSLLAHGVRPVTSCDFRKLWNAVLSELDVRESDIPAWPDIVLTL